MLPHVSYEGEFSFEFWSQQSIFLNTENWSCIFFDLFLRIKTFFFLADHSHPDCVCLFKFMRSSNSDVSFISSQSFIFCKKIIWIMFLLLHMRRVLDNIDNLKSGQRIHLIKKNFLELRSNRLLSFNWNSTWNLACCKIIGIH